VVRDVNREILHVAVIPCPTAEWTAQQLVECCAWDRWPPQFLIHDRHSRYGAIFERRLRHLGIVQVRTPFRAPRANAISERWVQSVRTKYLDHLFIFTGGPFAWSHFDVCHKFQTVGVRIGLMVNVRPLIRQPFRFEPAKPNTRSSQSQYSEEGITFMGVRHDGSVFCALQVASSSQVSRGKTNIVMSKGVIGVFCPPDSARVRIRSRSCHLRTKSKDKSINNFNFCCLPVDSPRSNSRIRMQRLHYSTLH
jgi:hypothetical protein